MIYYCDICKKGYKSKQSFTNHLTKKTHINKSNGISNYFCCICNNDYNTYKLLYQHKTTSKHKYIESLQLEYIEQCDNNNIFKLSKNELQTISYNYCNDNINWINFDTTTDLDLIFIYLYDIQYIQKHSNKEIKVKQINGQLKITNKVSFCELIKKHFLKNETDIKIINIKRSLDNW